MMDYTEYNILTQSLRELYLPAAQWLDAVSKFESNRYYNFTFTNQLYEQAAGKYIMKIPFHRPVWVYYYERLGHDLEDKDMKACKDLIDDRVGGYMCNALGEEYLQFLDSNSDFGIVVHTTSGQIHPFQYSETTGFKYTIIPTTTSADIICNKLRENSELDKNVPDEAWTLLKYKLQQRLLVDGDAVYAASYSMSYTTESGDMFYDPDQIYMDLTSHAYMTSDKAIGTIDYMDMMYKSHAKCIIVT